MSFIEYQEKEPSAPWCITPRSYRQTKNVKLPFPRIARMDNTHIKFLAHTTTFFYISSFCSPIFFLPLYQFGIPNMDWRYFTFLS